MIMKMDTFKTIFLDHEDFVSCKSFVPFYNEFEQSQYNARNLKFKREIIYLFL